MSDDDQRLLEAVKLLFWHQLERIERATGNAATNPLIERRAKNMRKHAEAQWLRESHDPNRIQHRLADIRAQAEHGSFYEAWADLQRIQENGDAAWRIASDRILETGAKQTKYLDETRADSNARRSAAAAKAAHSWQAVADEIWRDRPSLTKNAVAQIIKSRIGAPQSPQRIARMIKKPRHAG